MSTNLQHLVYQIVAILAILRTATGRTDIPDWELPEHRITNSLHYDEPPPRNPLNKVSLTQKGYIQFLRYIAEVPALPEFTFCVWLKSANLTYAHPLLSYSLHEEQRYIRAWISPHGKEINLAILENEVFKIPTYFREHVWYHICQSWESNKGAWNFFLNGKLKASGRVPKLKGLKIPKGGDIVVGQEYTDFDKGLDDGIEGDIFGFNLVLASTTSYPEVTHNFVEPYEGSQRRVFSPNQNYGPRSKPNSRNTMKQEFLQPRENYEYYLEPASQPAEEVPSVLSYFTVGANRLPKSIIEMGQNLFQNFMGWIQRKKRIRIKTIDESDVDGEKRFLYLVEPSVPESRIFSPQRANRRIISGSSRIVNDIEEVNHKPLGLQLVELSHNCALGKGAPLNHEKVLVSWTKTPVRVFGGAILKNVAPFCFKT